MTTVDWDSLRAAAIRVAQNAYAPYSRYPVGAAGLVVSDADDARIVTGCNVENASHGLGLCAECGLVSALHATGGGRLIAVCMVDAQSQLLAPCGRCRQLLFEHGGADCAVLLTDGVHTMGKLLPAAFELSPQPS